MYTMPGQMGIRELREQLTAAVRRVQQGETIEITHHGEPVAILGPVPADPLDRLIALGEVTLPKVPLEFPRPVPLTGPKTASEILEEDRSGR